MKKISTDKHIRPLLELGLSKTQAILYLAALQSGMPTALELSRLTKLNRQRVYEETEKLVDMGFFDVTRKQRRKYIPADPSILIKKGEEKLKRAEGLVANISSALPLYEELTTSQKSKVITKYYEGMDKIREAYAKELEISKNVEGLSFAGSIDDIFKFFPESYWSKWNKQYVKQGSRSRMLVHYSDAAKETAKYDKQYRRQTRYLENFSLKVNIDIIGNVVLIVSFYDELAIWIESPVLAQSYRIMFNALWAYAKPFK